MTYATEFQRTAAVLDWDNRALADTFYRGLKDNVKDNIICINPRPETLTEMIKHAVQINNQVYKRKMEKKGQHWNANQGKPCHTKKEDPYGPILIELDATQKLDKAEKKK